jgi:hypothetical protein
MMYSYSRKASLESLPHRLWTRGVGGVAASNFNRLECFLVCPPDFGSIVSFVPFFEFASLSADFTRQSVLSLVETTIMHRKDKKER